MWLAMLWCLACTGDDDPVPSDRSSAEETGHTGGAATPDSEDTGVPGDPVVFLVEPVLSVNDHGAGLTAWLDLTTDRPVTLALEVTGPDATRTWTVETEADVHHALLTGFRPDADHDVVVTAVAADGTTASATETWHSEPLPETTPAFDVVGGPGPMEPGVTLFKLAFHLYMVDADGIVVWFAPAPALTHEVELTERGTLRYHAGTSLVEEVALSGEVLSTWATDEGVPGSVVVAPDILHHDVAELPDGNLLALGVEVRTFPDYPASETDPRPTQPEAEVIGDVVYELAPDGTVVHAWPLLDRLDPYRIGYDSLTGAYWAGTFGSGARDWSHANAIAYDPVRDEVVVSLRHQDTVVALSRTTGDVAWLFAPDTHWGAPLQPLVLQPEGPTDLPAFHQHSASITPDGHLLMFDNGNGRASAWERELPSAQRWSRCLEAAIDPDAGTWTTVWSWGEQLTGGEAHYAGKVGDCDLLPETGNHLITFGSLDNPALPAVKLVEVDAAGGVVWELGVEAAGPDQVPSMFRSERVDGVIPGR